jgi:hypothetical protein
MNKSTSTIILLCMEGFITTLWLILGIEVRSDMSIEKIYNWLSRLDWHVSISTIYTLGGWRKY